MHFYPLTLHVPKNSRQSLVSGNTIPHHLRVANNFYLDYITCDLKFWNMSIIKNRINYMTFKIIIILNIVYVVQQYLPNDEPAKCKLYLAQDNILSEI